MTGRGRPAAIAAVAGLLLSTACFGGGDHDPLARQLTCQREDVPANYLLQVTGNFTDDDLRALRPGEATAADGAGLEGGSFSYWREIVPKPPFDPPITILCEAIAFADPAAAEAFIRDLPAGEELAFPSLVWLPGGGTEVTEIERSEGVPPGRFFRIAAEGDGTAVRLFGAYVANGRFVQAVFVGDEKGRAGLDDLAALVASVHARGAALAP